MKVRLSRVVPGDPFTDGLFNELADAINRSDTEFDSSGWFVYEKHPVTGTVVALQRKVPMMVRLTTSSGNHFAWEEVEPAAGGGYATFGGRSGTTSDDYAAEMNGNTSFALPRVVKARRAWGKLVFQVGLC
jgi:hypothetical protein